MNRILAVVSAISLVLDATAFALVEKKKKLSVILIREVFCMSAVISSKIETNLIWLILHFGVNGTFFLRELVAQRKG